MIKCFMENKSMKVLSKNTINKIQKILTGKSDAIAAYLFGSQATGFAGKESDLDIAIAVKDKRSLNELDFLKLFQDIHFPGNLDLSVIDNTSSPIFLFEIICHGKRIYKKNEDEATSFEAEVLRSYYNTRHLRDIYRLYLKENLEKGIYGY